VVLPHTIETSYRGAGRQAQYVLSLRSSISGALAVCGVDPSHTGIRLWAAETKGRTLLRYRGWLRGRYEAEAGEDEGARRRPTLRRGSEASTDSVPRPRKVAYCSIKLPRLIPPRPQ
jgi:hypothetical protein